MVLDGLSTDERFGWRYAPKDIIPWSDIFGGVFWLDLEPLCGQLM